MVARQFRVLEAASSSPATSTKIRGESNGLSSNFARGGLNRTSSAKAECECVKLGFICKQSVGARIARPFKMIVISRRTANGRPYVSSVRTSL